MFNKKLQIMKKLLCILWVAMLTMFATVFAQAVVMPVYSYFTITNKTTKEVKTVSVNDFTFNKTYDVLFSKGVYSGDQMEFTYKPALSSFTPQLSWSYGWLGSSLNILGTGLTVGMTIANVPSSDMYNNTLLIKCNYRSDGQSGISEDYIISISQVRQGNRITVKSSEVSEVQVSYEDYEKVSSAGQHATVALYDIYGNLVSTGYLDALGMSTLSTKGKPGIYIVKVIMNNQVIFNRRIQVK